MIGKVGFLFFISALISEELKKKIKTNKVFVFIRRLNIITFALAIIVSSFLVRLMTDNMLGRLVGIIVFLIGAYTLGGLRFIEEKK